MTLHVSDPQSLADLRVFLERADRAGVESVRCDARGSRLVVTVPMLAPRGLLDLTPTVLGIRITELRPGEDADAVVPVRSLLERIAHLSPVHPELTLPPSEFGASWAGVTPPQGGWERLGTVASAELTRLASEGARQVAEALPEQPGAAVLQRVRAEVWGAPLGVFELPSAVAFAAQSLGFLAEDDAVVYRSAGWHRVSFVRGHVLVRSQGRGLTPPLDSPASGVQR